MEVDKLFDDLSKYKTTNINFHAGDVYEHSIWSALYINHMFATNDKFIRDINIKWRKTLIVSCLLHDIGKGGDRVYSFYDKPNHPEIAGYYFETGIYPSDVRIDLRKVVRELGEIENYDLIKFLVRYHWMIGGVLKDTYDESVKAWNIYYQFNLDCHESKIPFKNRAEVFRLLYAVWVSDILASQKYPYTIDNGMPIKIDSIPEATHQGNDMFNKLKIEDTYPIREEIINVFETGYKYPNFAEKIQLYSGYIGQIGDKYYKRPLHGNPLLWSETKISPEKLRKSGDIKVYENKCKLFLEKGNPDTIPIFQAFPELVNLPKEKLAEIYGVICSSAAEYICPMLHVVDENFSGQEILSIKTNTLLYHGRGYSYCEPPNISDSRGFWLFDKKKYAYTYATGRDEDTKFPTEGYCWNILTYKTLKNIRLLNLSLREVRDKLREILKEFMCEVWYIQIGILDEYDNPTYENLIDYMFPKDIDPSKPDRVSHTTADINLSNVLRKIFPNLDGWYIESETMFPEIVIFKPLGIIQLVNHEYFDANRLHGILERCVTINKNKDNCVNHITTMFKKGKIFCLDFGKSQPIQCYLPEEIANAKIVTDEQFKNILNEIDEGNLIVQVK